MNGILICERCSQISELFHPFKEFITYLKVVILSCILVSRQDHILCGGGEGPRSRRYEPNAALRLLVQPYYEDEDDDYFLSFSK
jgi:hypothetical protein